MCPGPCGHKFNAVPHRLDRWMYRGGRPNRLATVLNGIWRLIGVAGLPPHRLNTLEVRGRRTGKLRSFPVVVADYADERYLVAMLGEGANWVANVRASGGHAVLAMAAAKACDSRRLIRPAAPPS